MSGEVKTILSNLPVLFFLIAILSAIAKVRRGRLGRRPVSVASTLWGELIFYYVGLSMIWVGILNAYFQGVVAPSIGWAPSPFEYELGWFEIAFGITALLSRGRGRAWRTAVTIPFVVFMLAAAAQHLNRIGVFWFGYIFSPLFIAAVALLSQEG